MPKFAERLNDLARKVWSPFPVGANENRLCIPVPFQTSPMCIAAIKYRLATAIPSLSNTLYLLYTTSYYCSQVSPWLFAIFPYSPSSLSLSRSNDITFRHLALPSLSDTQQAPPSRPTMTLQTILPLLCPRTTLQCFRWDSIHIHGQIKNQTPSRPGGSYDCSYDSMRLSILDYPCVVKIKIASDTH